jgi:hypothetical protein
LVAFGCKAYAITSDAQLKKKRKWRLAPKAWIGYMIDYRSSNSYRIWLFIENKIIIIRNVIFNENEFPIGDFEFFKNELIIIDIEALAQYIRDKELPSAELIWEKKCESIFSIEQMLQGADD